MTDWIQLVLQRDPRAMSAVLLGASFVLHVAATNLAWRYESLPVQGLGLWMARLARAVYELLRVLFYVGPLYLSLVMGWVDLRAVGLGPLGTSGLNWGSGLAWFLVLGLGAWGLLMLVWVPYLRATAPLTEHWTPPEWASLPRRLVEAILMQAHWAFYRAALAVILGDVYWGAMGALGLALLEAWADPRVRRYLTTVGQVENGVWSASLAIISAISYLLTLNLWLVALLHLGLEFTIPHLRVRPEMPEPAEEYSSYPEPTHIPALPPVPKPHK